MEIAARLSGQAPRALERLRTLGRQMAMLQAVRAHAPLAMHLQPDGFSLASVARAPGVRPRLLRCEFHEVPREADPGLALRALTQRENLDRASFRLVLNPGEYQLYQVESPEVPATELREALRWRVRELLDFPVEQAVIDAFDLPPAAHEAGRRSRMLCVVVTRAEMVARKVALVGRSGGDLDLIDIPELALRNLAALLGDDPRGAALLHVEAHTSLLLICAESTLYLSRRLDCGREQIAAQGVAPLAQELVRSMEYYESHFARLPVATLWIAPAGALAEPLRQELDRAVGVGAEDLDLNGLFENPSWLTPEQQARSLIAIGAALRNG